MTHIKKITVVLPIILLLLQGCSASGEGADPGITDTPIAYVKRANPVDNNGDPIQPDIRDPLLFMPGGDVYIKARASVTAPEENITDIITNGIGDAKDVSVSYDGKRILFSLRLEDPDPNDNTFFTWNIYEYDTETSALIRVITDDLKAEDGNDVSPYYLPDGRIVFSSDRQIQSKAVLLDEGISGLFKPQFSSTTEDRQTKALVLHVMENTSDGSDIHQITFNQSHDLDPVVLEDGRILFSRWDNSGNNNSIQLYTVSPDGSNLQLYYGAHDESHLDANGSTIQLTHPYQLSDGNILALSQSFTDTFGGGDIVIIDAVNYIDITQPTIINQGALTGPAQTDVTITNVINDSISTQGRYRSAYPLRDDSNRILVSRGLCQLEVTVTTMMEDTVVTHPCINPWLSDPTAVESPSSYGIWIYDQANNIERPIVQATPGMITTDAVALQSYTIPTVIYDKVIGDLDATLILESVGILNIRSVYDLGDNIFNGCYLSDCSTVSGITNVQELGDPGLTDSDDRPARFLRIVKAVGQPLPNDDRITSPDLAGTAFGPNINMGMREIIAYAPIEPDGSVRTKVPANVAFGIEVLDKFARRIGARHDNWIQVEPGDTLNCNSCHTHPSGAGAALPLPHGRDDASNPSINSGAPIDGYLFPNTQMPGTSVPYFGDAGNTMAEVRTRLFPSALTPNIDVVFEDVWTDPAVKTIDPPFSYTYTGIGGLSTTSPTPLICSTTWSSACRSVINYVQHINPLWSVDRGVTATCTNCHNNNLISGQLSLSSVNSDEEMDHLESYQDLLFEDAGQVVDGMGNLVDILITIPVFVLDINGDPELDINGDPVPLLDINGDPVTEDIPDPNAVVSASMSANGARVSYFMEKLTETELDATRDLGVSTVDHSGFMTAAELRLISEWLDIGAQYFNNPFDPTAPMN